MWGNSPCINVRLTKIGFLLLSWRLRHCMKAQALHRDFLFNFNKTALLISMSARIRKKQQHRNNKTQLYQTSYRFFLWEYILHSPFISLTDKTSSPQLHSMRNSISKTYLSKLLLREDMHHTLGISFTFLRLKSALGILLLKSVSFLNLLT